MRKVEVVWESADGVTHRKFCANQTEFEKTVRHLKSLGAKYKVRPWHNHTGKGSGFRGQECRRLSHHLVSQTRR